MVSEWNEYGLVPFHSTAFMHTVAYACLNDWDGLILYNYQTSEKENEPEDEILSVFDAYNDPSLICQWGMMAEVFLKGLVSPARNQVDLVYTQNDLKTLPNMMAAPIMYLPYVTRMRNVFLDGDTYGGKAKVAVNAGFVNDGNLENCRTWCILCVVRLRRYLSKRIRCKPLSRSCKRYKRSGIWYPFRQKKSCN